MFLKGMVISLPFMIPMIIGGIMRIKTLHINFNIDLELVVKLILAMILMQL